jgi:hypothetical protein
VLKNADAPFAHIGVTKGKSVCFRHNKKTLIDEKISALYEQWKNGVASLMS